MVSTTLRSRIDRDQQRGNVSDDRVPTTTVRMDEGALRQHVKGELRTRMRSLRRTLPAETRLEKSYRICAFLQEIEPVLQARVVGSFLAMSTEVDLAAFVGWLQARGQSVAVPRIAADGKSLEFCLLDSALTLEQHPLGFVQPSGVHPTIATSELDVVLVPALAIDLRGYRVGYGQAFYDRTLPQATRAVRIGVAFDFQLVPEVPDTPGDEPVHMVVTDKQIHRCSQSMAP
jgi:5-formyltetrahydrofolate cyclo-ligase